MENIYVPRLTKTIQINELNDKFKTLYPKNVLKLPLNDDEICQALKYDGTPDDFDALNLSVSLDHLDHSDDTRVQPFEPSRFQNIRNPIEIPKKALKLKTIANLVKQKRKNNDRFLKYNKHKFLHMENNGEPDLCPLEETILIIRFYEPFRYIRGIRNHNKPKFSQEFYVLGKQKLSELRDKIYCECKYGPFYDISEDPTKVTPKANHDHGFFFITDTIYKDTRDGNDDKYPEMLQKWSIKNNFTKSFNIAKMEETTFHDLTIKMCYPQVYYHFANCEHLFTFSDIRLLSKSDVLTSCSYPILRSISNSRTVNCCICAQTEADYLVKNSPKHVDDPAYLCAQCFKSFHYIDGKKVGQFEAYKFNGNIPIL